MWVYEYVFASLCMYMSVYMCMSVCLRVKSVWVRPDMATVVYGVHTPPCLFYLLYCWPVAYFFNNNLDR